MSKIFWKSFTEEISQVFEDEPFISPIFNEPEQTEEDKFMEACTTGNLEMVISCLANGVDPSLGQNVGIQKASGSGHISIVDLLVHEPLKRVDPSSFHNFAIQIARLYNRAEVENLLIQDPRVKKLDDFHQGRK
jgi:hypothetical protein